MSEQDAHLIFLHVDLLFEFGNGGGGGVHQRFGGGGFQIGRDAAAQPLVEDFQAFAEGIGAFPRDGELLVQREQLKIILGDLGDERDGDVAPGFLARQILRAGGFVQPPDAAPQINFPRGVDVGGKDIAAGAGWRRGVSAATFCPAAGGGAVIHLREELPARACAARARACSTRVTAMRKS